MTQITKSLIAPCDVIGRGRMGQALTAALTATGQHVRGPLGRGATAEGAAVVLLCVPDREIASAAAAVIRGPIVGHVSASAPLALLEPHERFVLHPLLSVASPDVRFAGATCAIVGSSARAADVATSLAGQLGMRPRMIDEAKRALYHAAASAASNYLTTTLALAERLAAFVDLDRDALIPLVQSAIDQWASLGAAEALTGPVVRGDEITVDRQRAAVAAADAELLPLWDALVLATRALAAR